MAGVRINGVLHDWERVTVTGPQGTFIGITDISWKVKKEVKLRYGKGSIPRGYGRGNYEPDGSMTLDQDEFTRLNKAVEGGVLRRPWDLTIVCEPEGADKVTRVLKGLWVTGIDESAKQGEDNAMQTKLDFVVLMIERDGQPDYADYAGAGA